MNLASDLITAGVNPFLSRLPRPLRPEATTAEASPTDTAQAAPALPADPLAAVKLLGIVYNPKAPVALISVENAKYPSQVVRPGDAVSLQDGKAIIGRITQTSIEILMAGPSKEKRKMELPDIVGYASSPKNDASPTLEELPDEAQRGKKAEPGRSVESSQGGGSHDPSVLDARNPASKSKPAHGQSGPPMGGGSGVSDAALSNLKRLAAGLTEANASSPQH